MLYCIIYIKYSNVNFPCHEIISYVEKFFYLNFFNSVDGYVNFSNIIVNFGNYIVNSYYEFFTLKTKITKNYTQEEKDILTLNKNIFQTSIAELFEHLFINFYIQNSNNINDNKKEFLKQSGYQCFKNSDCYSNKCVNNICYINEKEVNREDIRSVGNPCVYDSQCRSGSCVENICNGDDNLEIIEFPEYIFEE